MMKSIICAIKRPNPINTTLPDKTTVSIPQETMLRRVSSRPRLVSDADAAFQASLEVDSSVEDVYGGDDVSNVAVYDADHNAMAMLPSFDSFASCLDIKDESSTMASIKRKRLSHYMTPVSSCSSLMSPSLIHPLCDVASTDVSKHAIPNKSSLASLPEEALVSIACYLSSAEIRALSSASVRFRAALMYGQGGIESLWMEKLRGQFPQVFADSDGCKNDRSDDVMDVVTSGDSGGAMLTSAQVTFVDSSTEYPSSIRNQPSVASVNLFNEISFTGLPISDTESNEANLALLEALIPKRYPRCIDEATLNMSGRRHAFRVFSMEVDTDINNRECDAALVPVVQFVGRVGTGDRCIRSDQAFPYVKTIHDTKVPTCGSRLPWKFKSKSGKLQSSNSDNATGAATSSGMLYPSTPASHSSTAAASSLRHPSPSTPTTPHSPLLRLLSGLSHHSDASMYESQSSNGMQFDTQESDEEEEIGINNYGMFSFGKCKERLGKIALGCKKSKAGSLKPFVVPVVLSRAQYNNVGKSVYNAGLEKRLIVDLTPRLCAYFEVTIMKHSNPSDNEDGNRFQRPTFDASISSANNLNPRAHPNPMPHYNGMAQRHNLWRRDALPMYPLLDMADLLLPPFPIQHHHHYPFNAPLPNTTRSRHECVAIGLSTLAFNPRDKMPGWDGNSYGYHGDDGGIFHGHGDMLRRYGPSFGPGDVIGCGLEYTTKRVFFVKNGEFLGYAFDVREDVMEKGLYPTVGVDTECPLFVNFGTKPFLFDLSKFLREGWE